MALRSAPAEKKPGRPASTSAAGGSAATCSRAATSSSSSPTSIALAGGRSARRTATPSWSVSVMWGIGVDPTPGTMASVTTAVEIETPHGAAWAHLHPAGGSPRAALVLGHGAGGGVGAPDLVAATRAAIAGGGSIALVEQPSRVGGRRSPAPAHHLDAAWAAVVEHLRAQELHGLRVLTGGRSSGAR